MDLTVQDNKLTMFKMHIIHLEKMGCAAEHVPEQPANFPLPDTNNKVKRQEKMFFSYGYYDRLTYVVEDPLQEQTYFTYEHAFSIAYPYSKSKSPIMADQLFTLLEPWKEGQEEVNPFMDDADGKPFLGLYLIGVNGLVKNSSRMPLEFWPSLIQMRDCLKKKLKQKCAQVYFSTNCADLCVVLRTHTLGEIYRTKKELSNYMVPKGMSDTPSIHTTLYIVSDFSEGKQSLADEEVVKKNRKHEIEIRMQSSKEIAKELQKLVMQLKYNKMVGATGKGEYILRLPYEAFAGIYHAYVEINWNRYEPGDALNDKEGQLCAFLKEHYSQIRFVYERWHIPLGEDSSKSADLEDDFREKKEKICITMRNSLKEIRKLADELISNKEDAAAFPKQRFNEQVQQIRDLLYTFNSLWYDENTVSEGCVFYAQMCALVEGINQQLVLIRTAQERWKKFGGREIKIETLKIINNDLISNMNIMVSGINDFNKLIQAVNQNLINVPNYEMHSKVNVEKYLYAYTMYLMEICNRYYKDKGKQAGRIFPTVTISQVAQNITAPTLFQVMDDLEKKRDELRVFLVRCPNYQRFANVLHVLPMISHEISHCFRYIDREVRNRFIIEYLSQKMAEIVTYRLFQLNPDRNHIQTEAGSMKFVYDVIRTELNNNMYEVMRPKLDSLHLNNMYKICVSEMRESLTGTRYGEIWENRLWELSKKNFKDLFALCSITYVTPERVETEREKCSIDAVLNLILDIFDRDAEKLARWQRVLSKDEVFEDLQKDEMLKELCTIQQDYTDRNIVTLKTVSQGIRVIVKRMWRSFLLTNESRCKKFRVDRDIQKCVVGISNKIENMADGNAVIEADEIKLIANVFELDQEETFRFERCILEAAGLIREILGQWVTTLTEGVFYISDGAENNFAETIHKALNMEYERRISVPNENLWLFTQKTQKRYMSLGIINDDPKQFKEILKDAVNSIGEEYILRNLRDNMTLYEEVFADLGMCKMLGFTSFGYFAYTIHLYMKERELPKGIAHNLLAERMKLVIYTLWLASAKDNDINNRIVELKKQIEEYGIKINSVKSNTMNEKESHMHKRMLEWMKSLYKDMKLNFFPEENQMLVKHLNKVYGEDMEFLTGVKEPLAGKIGDYYNHFIENANNPRARKDEMDLQNNFVLYYYGKMRDACERINLQKLSSISRGIDFIVEYNKQFMQWQMGEES